MITVDKSKVASHTPIPWQAHGCTIYSGDYWHEGTNYGGRKVACTFDSEAFPDDLPTAEDSANADFITLAVNCHYDLLEACKSALCWMSDNGFKPPVTSDLENAIAEATGGQP